MICRNPVVAQFLAYCQTTTFNGVSLSKDPDVREVMADVFIKNEIIRIFGLRTYWLSHEYQPRSYEGPQLPYNHKMKALDVAETILQSFGSYSMFDGDEWAPLQGLLEVTQRSAVVGCIWAAR